MKAKKNKEEQEEENPPSSEEEFEVDHDELFEGLASTSD
jgi:hypothetical protein